MLLPCAWNRAKYMTPPFCLILPLMSSFTQPPRKKGGEGHYCDPSVLAMDTPTLCQAALRGEAAARGHHFRCAMSGGGRQVRLAMSWLLPAPFQLPLALWQWRCCRNRFPAHCPHTSCAANSQLFTRDGLPGKALEQDTEGTAAQPGTNPCFGVLHSLL